MSPPNHLTAASDAESWSSWIARHSANAQEDVDGDSDNVGTLPITGEQLRADSAQLTARSSGVRDDEHGLVSVSARLDPLTLEASLVHESSLPSLRDARVAELDPVVADGDGSGSHGDHDRGVPSQGHVQERPTGRLASSPLLHVQLSSGLDHGERATHESIV